MDQIKAGGAFRLHPIRNGANNRVYRLVWRNGEALLKVYVRYPRDRRDRLGAEYAFYQYVWNVGLRAIPKPLACSPGDGMALFEFVHGVLLRPGQITRRAMEQPLAFYAGINRKNHSSAAIRLPNASEACFSLAEHVSCVEKRLKKLSIIRTDDRISQEAAAFIQTSLQQSWERVTASAQMAAQRQGLSWTRKLARADRCLSPSDFGFHNALKMSDGQFRFFDFEYAGWDDPAKFVCDFFFQPKVRVPKAYLRWVIQRAAFGEAHRRSLTERINILMPVYRIKWCCIMLNEFTPWGYRRRRFADRKRSLADQKRTQLEKARRLLAEREHGLH